MTWRRWLIDIALIAGGVVSVVFEPFSIAIHSVIGLAFVGTVGPHLWHRRSWIRGTLRRLRERRRFSPKLRWSFGQAVFLSAAVVVVTFSGLWDWLGVPTKIRFHAISGVILIGVVAWHAWTRRSWLTRRRSTVAAQESAGDRCDGDGARSRVR
jgi:membrane protein implicated in regulation of membrane protease activity